MGSCKKRGFFPFFDCTKYLVFFVLLYLGNPDELVLVVDEFQLIAVC
jgi:hypothetical protein